MTSARSSDPSSSPTAELAFLLAQVGAHAAARFAERLAPLKLLPPHAGILRAVGQSDGLSQAALSERLGMFPSRLVVLLDALEERGLLERRSTPEDRRSYALHLTRAGKEMVQQIGRVAEEHKEALCAALDGAEQAQLAALLRRIADEQALTAGVHPGYRKLGRGRPADPDG
ncbi:MarR family transcriptional regulator [Sorangium cellulosum]|uniref:MarR family transcriptional regulator n=1 Tax=Sorangium cellulosum TaxID=56 RepID=A0A2L0EML1_SORCE|nr:MarR family transcriptional regulator [Sorangium cellulosum]AUX40541.1 MarR family transcriptional regulator [Sorangium cellulosum]